MRPDHFHRFMHALGWIDAEGSPIHLKLGRPNHRFHVASDWALMVVMARVCRPHRQDDIAKIMGGCRSMVSETANIITDKLYDAFVPGSNRLVNWQHWFPM